MAEAEAGSSDEPGGRRVQRRRRPTRRGVGAPWRGGQGAGRRTWRCHRCASARRRATRTTTRRAAWPGWRDGGVRAPRAGRGRRHSSFVATGRPCGRAPHGTVWLTQWPPSELERRRKKSVQLVYVYGDLLALSTLLTLLSHRVGVGVLGLDGSHRCVTSAEALPRILRRVGQAAGAPATELRACLHAPHSLTGLCTGGGGGGGGGAGSRQACDGLFRFARCSSGGPTKIVADVLGNWRFASRSSDRCAHASTTQVDSADPTLLPALSCARAAARLPQGQPGWWRGSTWWSRASWTSARAARPRPC
jgi:hypothetical protein